MVTLIAKWFPWVLLAPALLPLVYVDGLLYPYVAPKTLLFRTLFIVAAAAFAYLALSGHTFYWKRLSPKSTENGSLYFFFAWTPAVLLVVAYATSLLGIDFYHSFWSIFDRGDGLLTLTAAVGFFYLILLYADKEFLRKLFSVAAWVGSLVAVYAVLQWLQSVSGMNIPVIAEPRGRFGATFGNAAFLAAYLGMTLFASLAVLSEYRGRWLRALQIGAGLQLLAIILAATRGTLLALFMAGVLAAVYLALKGGSSTSFGKDQDKSLGASGRMHTYARGGLLVAVVLAGLFFMFRSPLSESSFEPVRRIASISLNDVTVSSRLFVWKNVFEEAKLKPLTGYGAEHVDVLFNRVYDPGDILEEWFDRSHNAYLDYFVQYGILGVLLYTGIIAGLGWSGWRLYKKEVSEKHRERFSVFFRGYGPYVVLMALVYALQNFFVFDTAMTLWFLFAILAAVLAYAGTVTPPSTSKYGNVGRLPKAIPVAVGVAILALLYPVAIQPLRANLALAQGYLYHVIDVDRSITQMQKGLSLGTYADLEYGYQAYSMYTDQQQVMLEGQERVRAYRYALETLTKNYERYPYDARTAVYLAHVLDSAPPEEDVDEEFLRAVLARAVELSPQRAQGKYILANISLKKGDRAQGVEERTRYYREAIVILEEYAVEVPDLAETYYIIANLYLVLDERASAKKWADGGLVLYKERGGKGAASRAIKYYIAVEDWQNALLFMKDIVEERGRNFEEIYDLAKLYFLTGDRDHALGIVERLRRDAPGLVETDPAFVRAIESIQ